MAKSIPLIVFPAKDLDKTKKFFNTYLETGPYVDGEYYVGYRLEGLEVGLDPNGTAVISYIDVDNIEASLKTLKEDAGATIVKESTNVGGGLLVAQVEVDGNILGLRQQPK